MEVERPKQADYSVEVERGEWRQTEGGLWYRPLLIGCFAFALVGGLVEEAGGGEAITGAGMVLGVGVFVLFAWWLVRRFVRQDEPPLTLTEMVEQPPMAPLDVRRLDTFADALQRERARVP